MQATVRPAEDFLQDEPEQDRPLSLWFWIVPLALLLTFVAIFASHRHDRPAHVSAVSAINTLPEVGVVQFDSGKPSLTPDGQAALDRAADAMRGNPNVRLRLEGYEALRAKSRKKDRRIDTLTLQRALAVENYLDAKGIERTRVTGGKFAHAAGNLGAFVERNVDSRRAELYAQ